MGYDPKEVYTLLDKPFRANYHQWRSMEQADKQEYSRRLSTIAQSRYHAEQIIRKAIDGIKMLPSMAELNEISEQVSREPSHEANKHGCDRCQYTGYISAWYLFTIERHPSGAVKRLQREIIPPTPGKENLYLITIPDLQAKVDGINQIVQIAASRCDCVSVRIP